MHGCPLRISVYRYPRIKFLYLFSTCVCLQEIIKTVLAILFFLQVYSQELENVAQTFADQCSFAHSNRTVRNSLSPTFVQVGVGENIYVGAGVPLNYTDVIARQFGFDEAAFYDYNTNSCQSDKVCGHYTQVYTK